MQQVVPSSYDKVPYASYPYPQTHPNRLATVATLFGMTPKAITRARVLELGCAGGGNLIPMAQALPASQFVGIDLSLRQVQDGRSAVKDLQLDNVELHHMSIMDVNADLGEFDYIVCHGVYSWVGDEVKDKILEICAHQLTRQGVAYVSYNTYPGWHMCESIRRMMIYHTRGIEDPKTQVAQAKALLDFLAQSVSGDENPYALLLKQESKRLQQKADFYLWHEHLEDVNTPTYFHQFAEKAISHGLQYLGEADVAAMSELTFPPEVQKTLRKLAPNIIKMEQYMDFLRNRTFRQTLLCHKELQLNRKLSHANLKGLYVSCAARPVSSQPSLAAGVQEQFKHPREMTLSSGDPLLKAALVHLSRSWPRAVPLESLCVTARQLLDPTPVGSAATAADDFRTLGLRLLQAYANNFVQLSVHAPAFATQPGDKPVASSLARLQANKSDVVTNLCHETVKLSEFNRQLVRQLDGSRDRHELVDVLAKLVEHNVLVVQDDQGVPIVDRHRRTALLKTAVDRNLPQLARQALLVA